MISLTFVMLVNVIPLWFIFISYFYNFYTALNLSFKAWKVWLVAGIFCLSDFAWIYLFGSFELEKISFILIILLIVSPIIWKKSEESFFKVVSICLLLTGLHLSFTILSDVVSTQVVAMTGIGMEGYTKSSLLFVSIITYLVQLIMCLLLNLFLRSNRGRRTVKHLFQTPGVSWLTFISAILMTVILIGYFFNYYNFLLGKTGLAFFLLAVYVFFGLVFGLSLGILSYIRLYQDKLKAAEALLIQQQSYNRVLEDIQQDVRHFQHDYKNILSSFYLQLKEGRVEEAQVLLEEKFLSFDQNVSYNIKQMSFLNNIKPMEIKSLLLTKMLQMEQKNIKFQVEVMDSISEFHIETEDLVRCLGILLDNAMEEETLTEEKTVHFVAYQDDSTVTIMIKNHLQEEKKIAEITQEGYSTKGDNRGIGLSSYQKILTKYPNVLNKTVVSDNQFQQVLKMQIS
ncbi:GHKL domain-containing protein [Vagococcus sp. BWB3-3]|uniref:GHKL domain-containing protein n=1 Tax=Vagococcus allomyrinae TaxID=2794353 RepID=A0A940P6D5_9ENTE|nr:GHKL domain-containing protein [Vagococcus allomyrinae]MBP1042247.1 GHKL domain-containing protein [Vagococcus allomyrinae]